MTLVEVLIALVVLLLVSLAMLQTALLSIENNMVNVLRDEAVSVAEMRMNEARNMPFDALASEGAEVLVSRMVRNLPPPGIVYSTRMTVTSPTADSRQINIRVRWEWKDNTVANGNPFTHSITTIVRSHD